ncbi:MAG: peptidoglycan DD-metalloendopeptidase family protein [Deltaproteobacteria bacterium]|nr:peptidoglycan DD-metalloendopeptidase family protein [Deltaproteobacteria bacterium]
MSFNFLSDVPSCSAAFSESDERLKRIETDLSREKEQYLKFNEKEKALLKQLSEIEADIEEKRSSVKKLKEEINRRKKELGERQKYLEQLNKSLINIEGLLSRRLVAFYKYAKKGYLQVLSTTTSLDQLAKRMKYLKVILGGDKAAMSFMLKELIKYRQESAYLEKDLDIIAQLEKKENSQLSSIKQDLEKKVILLAKIHREKEFYETAVRELEHAAENIKQTIMNLEIEDDTEKVKGLPEDFNTSKGNLALPLEGDIIKDSEELGSNPLIPQKGIYIRGSLGKDVKAIFPGRVDFSGQLKGYGQVVVINHGSRYFTVSANLLERTREEGDMVKEGDVIGLVGETGLKIGPGLYFEIRKGEENLEPLKWLKVN